MRPAFFTLSAKLSQVGENGLLHICNFPKKKSRFGAAHCENCDPEKQLGSIFLNKLTFIIFSFYFSHSIYSLSQSSEAKDSGTRGLSLFGLSISEEKKIKPNSNEV